MCKISHNFRYGLNFFFKLLAFLHFVIVVVVGVIDVVAVCLFGLKIGVKTYIQDKFSHMINVVVLKNEQKLAPII